MQDKTKNLIFKGNDPLDSLPCVTENNIKRIQYTSMKVNSLKTYNHI